MTKLSLHFAGVQPRCNHFVHDLVPVGNGAEEALINIIAELTSLHTVSMQSKRPALLFIA